ncbi:MAG: FlgD Ig-like domain [Thermoleophilaceae bacterium]|jgi:flagellar hook assembly protein FlgD|nr:FlgD Ig-like domain [Thermoleophilaceae bacterium]
MPKGRNLAITLLMLGLIAAAGLAFVETQTLKLEKPAARLILVPEAVSPGCKCPLEKAKLEVLFQKAETVNLRIVQADPPNSVIATVAEDVAAGPGRFSIKWNGLDQDGQPAPVGQYRVRVELAGEGRTYTFADRIKVVHPGQVSRDSQKR